MTPTLVRPEQPADAGTITLLTLGFLAVLIGLVVTVVDVSAVYLDRRDLAGECDSAALAAAQAVDPSSVYAGGVGSALPVTQGSGSVAAQTVTRLVGAGTTSTVSVAGDTVTVACSRVVTLPVGSVIGIGTFTVQAGSSATSPVR